MSSNGEQPAIKAVIDWRRGAELLAQGIKVSEAAREIGCSRSQLSRRRNRDERFQAWIKAFEEAPAPQGDGSMASLRQRLEDAIDAEVRNGNVRVILWLADRMKLVSPPEKNEEKSALEDLLQGMTEADIKEFESLK